MAHGQAKSKWGERRRLVSPLGGDLMHEHGKGSGIQSAQATSPGYSPRSPAPSRIALSDSSLIPSEWCDCPSSSLCPRRLSNGRTTHAQHGVLGLRKRLFDPRHSEGDT